MWRQNIKSLNGLKMQAMAQRADWHPHTHSDKGELITPTHTHTDTYALTTHAASSSAAAQ